VEDGAAMTLYDQSGRCHAHQSDPCYVCAARQVALRQLSTGDILSAALIILCEAVDEAEVRALDMGVVYQLPHKEWDALIATRDAIANALIPDMVKKR
jgi:hypothetical protein